jgi:hypothetical protein
MAQIAQVAKGGRMSIINDIFSIGARIVNIPVKIVEDVFDVDDKKEISSAIDRVADKLENDDE